MSNNNYTPEIVINAIIAHKGDKQVCFGVVSSVSNNVSSNIGGVDIITKNVTPEYMSRSASLIVRP